MNITMLIAEPSDILRAGLRSIFIEDERISRVEEVRTQADLLKSLHLFKVDLVIVNQMLVDSTIVEAVLPQRRFVILANELDMDVLKLVHRKQARGYLLETSSIDLLRVVPTLSAETFLLDPSLTPQVLEDSIYREHPQVDYSVLTAREREIVGLLHEGVQRSDIAERLYISKATLKTHIKNINRKLNTSTTEGNIRTMTRRRPYIGA